MNDIVAILDNYCDDIVNLLMTIVCCLAMLLVAFEIIDGLFLLIIIVISNAIKPIITKRIKQYYQKQPPTQKAIKIGKMFNWLSWFILIGVGVFCFYDLIFQKF